MAGQFFAKLIFVQQEYFYLTSFFFPVPEKLISQNCGFSNIFSFE